MRELRITERYGQVTVTTSDGRKGVGATLPSALNKTLRCDLPWVNLAGLFSEIQSTPEAGQIREGVQGT